jgi:hypothetical protein
VAAADAFEYAPPSFSVEVAAMLRSAALVALGEIDPSLAGYHACAHLDDADQMSAEPALTAARILGAFDQLAPLYAYGWAHTAGDVLAECLRRLGGAPVSILDRVIDRHRQSGDQAVQAALVDLLLDHPERARAERELLDLLGAAPPAVFRYGATVLVARREVDLARRLGELPEVMEQPERAAIYAEAASLLP